MTSCCSLLLPVVKILSYPGARRDDERLHARSGVVALLLAEAGVDDVDYAVDGQRRFCDVGGHHHLGEDTETGSDALRPRYTTNPRHFRTER